MALSDYYLCDLCGCKTFYDPEGAYEESFVGDMVVLCVDCAKTHEIKIEPKPTEVRNED